MAASRKKKVNIARRGRTREEIVGKVSIWDTAFWRARKQAIAERVKKRQSSIKEEK